MNLIIIMTKKKQNDIIRMKKKIINMKSKCTRNSGCHCVKITKTLNSEKENDGYDVGGGNIFLYRLTIISAKKERFMFINKKVH